MSARPLEVHKFGGTSVGDADRITRVARLISDRRVDADVCVVSSAMSGVTNRLVDLVSLGRGAANERAERLEWLRTHHERTLADLDLDAQARDGVRDCLDDLDALVAPLDQFHRTPPALSDRIQSMGERLAVELVAGALRKLGAPARAMPADAFLETGWSFGESEPNSYVDDRRTAAALRVVLRDGGVPVVTGFMGRGPEGDTRLLGRGGSDLTGALLASALDADELVIWTDVEGVRTCDPRLVSGAEPIERLHYREASEMAFFGSKVLHQRVMLPVAGKRIPVSVRSTMRPEGASTRIDASFGERAGGYAVSVMRPVALISLEGGGFAGVAGISARLFDALADASVSVAMISQGSSESSICLAVRDQDAEAAESAIRSAFRRDLGRGVVDDVVVQDDVAIVTAVGAGMNHRVGAAARMTDALAARGVNILAIAQGSSELSISFAVEAAHAQAAAQALHGVGREEEPRLRVALAGIGNVGRAVARCVARHPTFELVGVVDSSGFLCAPEGVSAEAVESLARHKADGGSIMDADVGATLGDANAMLDAVQASRSGGLVLVDCTALPSMVAAAQRALERSVSVVTANKEILACDGSAYQSLRDAEREGGGRLLGESTVGAGLPIARTLETIQGAGDRVVRIEASLSGTIGLILDQLATGRALAAIVEEAVAKGFAEPDPREDLLGRDMTRKAVILARMAGLSESVAVEPFAPMSSGDVSDPSVREALDRAGAGISQRLSAAKERGEEVKYLAVIDRAEGASLRLREIETTSPLCGMLGAEVGAAIWTELNGERPIVVRGTGAGADPTAFGVISDLATIASFMGVGVVGGGA